MKVEKFDNKEDLLKAIKNSGGKGFGIEVEVCEEKKTRRAPRATGAGTFQIVLNTIVGMAFTIALIVHIASGEYATAGWIGMATVWFILYLVQGKFLTFVMNQTYELGDKSMEALDRAKEIIKDQQELIEELKKPKRKGKITTKKKN